MILGQIASYKYVYYHSPNGSNCRPFCQPLLTGGTCRVGHGYDAITTAFELSSSVCSRYSSLVTRQRALCVIMLCWVGSVLASFAQFIGSDVFNTWRNGDGSPDTTGLGLNDNETTPSPHPTRSPFPASHHDGREVIAKFLPYGGFLSKFYVEDKRNFTYAEIHSSHWGVCAPDLVLTPQFLVYVHGMTVFILPILCLLAIYLCLLCLKSRQVADNHEDRLKQISCQLRSLTLSLSLLVALCSPFHIIHALMLLSPNTKIPAWVKAVAAFLFQLYSLVPQLLFTPQWQRAVEEQAVLPLPVGNFSPVESGKSKGKLVTMALCEAVQTSQWVSAKHSLRSKVCPEV